jgi:outer membrane lipoprotein-sorting protein
MLENTEPIGPAALTTDRSFARVTPRIVQTCSSSTMPGRAGVRSARLAAATLSVVTAGVWACGLKRTVSVPVSPRILEAKTASLDQLLELLKQRSDKIVSLSSNSLKITLTTGRVESGKLQEYRSAPGYILLSRPDSLRLNVQNPITKTTILDMLSVDDDFSIWYPRENKFYTGMNSIREFETDDRSQGSPFTARPRHLLEAMLPQPFLPDDPALRVSVEENQDANARYYILSLFKEKGGRELQPLKRVWIERSQLVPVKEEWFTPEGGAGGVVSYSNFATADGAVLPLSIVIDRPMDGYSLDLQARNWKLNPNLPATAFVLNPPASAERVVLREKVPRKDK